MSAKLVLMLCCCCVFIVACSSSAKEENFLSDFSGKYSNSQVFTFETLTINPDGTFSNYMWFDTGASFTLSGKIELNGNSITLLFDLNDINYVRELDAIPVRWGDRRYVFYSHEGSEGVVAKFCNGIADGATSQKDDEGDLLFIFSRKNNSGAATFGEPELINGERFCK